MPILRTGTIEFVQIEQVSALFTLHLGQVLQYLLVEKFPSSLLLFYEIKVRNACYVLAVSESGVLPPFCTDVAQSPHPSIKWHFRGTRRSLVTASKASTNELIPTGLHQHMFVNQASLFN
jgi:hypothetical protein